MHILEDMWGDPVNVGDTVIASRPAGAGTTMLEYCKVHKINDKSVTLISLGRDGNPKALNYSWEAPHFILQKKRSGDGCQKIVKYTA